MTKTTEPVLESLAEVLCTERCAQAGDPPCSKAAPDEPHCDECLGMAKAVIEAQAPAPSQPVQPVAWLKEWTNQPDGEQYRRVDLRAESEDWLEHRKPTITPLYTHPTPSPDVAGLVERLREVSSVLFDDYGDGTYAVEDYALATKAADRIEALEADREQVERDTIRRVVEWLRDVLDPLDADHEGWLATWVADAIAAGEWKQ